MSPANICRIQARAALYLSDEVAAVAGMSLDQFKQFSLGRQFTATDQQLRALARRMGLKLQGAQQ
ncbi:MULTISPECIES: hypothetical protein [unclassified Bradyrhizobium]|uniref:hypothetical protein n=1 Tax=unclassified Bradyrhizobium TaxID=2631580 RepID=UPI003390EFFE